MSRAAGREGPAIVATNHNSHLDILTLLSLFPLSAIPNVQPAAAADYFFKTPLLRWFSLNVIGIIPVVRGGAKAGAAPLVECYRALEQGRITDVKAKSIFYSFMSAMTQLLL